MSDKDEPVPAPDSSASGQERGDRPLPAVIPPAPGDGLAGYELPEAFRAAGEGGIRGTALLFAMKWVEQQTKEMGALRDENREARARNDELTRELSDTRRDNAVLGERLGTRWVTQATGGVGAILVGAAIGLPDARVAYILAGLGILLLAIAWIELRRSR